MNIVLATDNNYVQHCCVTMTSILLHNENVRFFIFTEGLSSDNVSVLKNQSEKYGGNLEIITVYSDVIKKMPMPSCASDHISVATYYRLFVSSLLPADIERIIYLDCDIIVRGDLSVLWAMDIDRYALAAVYQNNEWSDGADSWNRLSISRNTGYFNAGVLLINLKYWRDNNVEERLLGYIANNYDLIHSHDQDTLNAVLGNEMCPLDCSYNFLPNFYMNMLELSFPDKVDYAQKIPIVKKNPTIVHYVYKPKPWESGCNHPLRKEYYKYLNYTPWKGWKPKINFKSIYRNRIKLPLLVFRRDMLINLGLRKK